MILDRFVGAVEPHTRKNFATYGPIFGEMWGNATVSPFPFVLISFGGTAFPQKILGGPGTACTHIPPQLHHWLAE